MDNIVFQPLSLGHGQLKVLVKDTIDIKGYKTVAGSKALQNTDVAHQHAQIVEHILNQDCTIIGKANLHELAFGITGINHFSGTPVNPKYPALIPGGSSSGCAVAVANQLVDFAIGTDTGGSIRMPAACCGVIGFKPTFARVSRVGVAPQQSSLDCVGPMATSMSAIVHAMSIIDPSFQSERAQANQIRALRLAVLDVYAEDDVWQAVQAFLQHAMSQPLPKVSCAAFEKAYHAGMQIINYETWQAFGELLATGKVGSDVAQRLLKAAKTTVQDVAQANRIRAEFSLQLDDLLENFDALVLPTLPNIPPEVVDAENTSAFLNLTALIRPFNLSGHPAINLPLESATGLPVGLQIVARHHDDEKLCAIAAYLIECVTAI